MLSNYFKIACRNISRHKFFTIINIAGLAMSMSLGLLIVTLINDLLSYDNFHSNRKDIYRVITKVQSNTGYSDLKATCPFPVANELENNYQGYEHIARIQRYFNAKATGNKKELQMEGYFTESSFLQLFSFPLIKGNKQTALEHPNSIVITEKAAQKFFEDADPMGKIISMNGFGEYIVTGVIATPPVNSHLTFDVLGSLSSLNNLEKNNTNEAGINNWNETFKNYVYIQKSPGLTIKQINRDLQQIAQKSKSLTKDVQLSFQLQSLTAIVPGPDLSTQIGPKMSYLPLVIMSGVVILILISACINYTNLSLARALRRAKEIGTRKAIGGSTKQLFTQFLTETFIISLLSLAVACIILQFIKPGFLEVIPRASEMFTLNITPGVLLGFLAFALFTGLLAGILPASILSRLPVIQALKNDTALKTLGKINLKKALIVFQFTLSLIFIVGSIVIYRQYQFSLNYDYGFSTKNKILVPLEGVNYALFKNEFQKNAQIKSITGSSSIAGSFQTNSTWLKLPGQIDSLSADYLQTDENFIENLALHLIAGNSFITAGKPNEQSVIINEQLTQAIGIKHAKEAIGKVIVIDEQQMEVIGVVKDFNYAHLEEPIRNFIFFYNPDKVQYAYLSLQGAFNESTQKLMEPAWKKLSGNNRFPGVTMELFLEETYSFYTNFIKIFGFIAFLAISIGSLGLIGMSLYVAQSRLKEVGIRKVMGASVGSILLLLSKSFIWLMLIAASIALPVSYILFKQVLENGFYHIGIGIVELSSGFLILVLVGGITIISQVWKTAISNPVKSLRSE